MEHLANLSGAVTGFSVAEKYIDCICGKELIKLEKSSGDIVCKKEIFEKDGLSRNLIADDEQIFIYDFCALYAFRRSDFELLGKWQLGSDLSSDICGIVIDNDTVYCSIRNGRIITINRQSYQTKEFYIGESSMWSIGIYDKYLICGTVDGKLLLMDKKSFYVEKELVLSKKNVGSLYFSGETLYAASHDGNLFKIDMRDFEVESLTKNAHRKMFNCAGIYKDKLITVSCPCSELALWDKNTLQKLKVIAIPLKLSGRAYIERELLYISSRNISGIGIVRLSEC